MKYTFIIQLIMKSEIYNGHAFGKYPLVLISKLRIKVKNVRNGYKRFGNRFGNTFSWNLQIKWMTRSKDKVESAN